MQPFPISFNWSKKYHSSYLLQPATGNRHSLRQPHCINASNVSPPCPSQIPIVIITDAATWVRNSPLKRAKFSQKPICASFHLQNSYSFTFPQRSLYLSPYRPLLPAFGRFYTLQSTAMVFTGLRTARHVCLTNNSLGIRQREAELSSSLHQILIPTIYSSPCFEETSNSAERIKQINSNITGQLSNWKNTLGMVASFFYEFSQTTYFQRLVVHIKEKKTTNEPQLWYCHW